MAADEGFKPDDDLAAFLAKGDAPVYIGYVIFISKSGLIHSDLVQ
jgi:hypothetical protein